MALQKKCKTCGFKKDFTAFSKVAGSKRKLQDECDECIKMQKAGLDPKGPKIAPTQVEDRQQEEIERQKRRQRYLTLIKQRQQGVEA